MHESTNIDSFLFEGNCLQTSKELRTIFDENLQKQIDPTKQLEELISVCKVDYEGGNDGDSSNSISDDEGGNDSNLSDSPSDEEGPEEGGKPTNPSGNGDGGNSGNKGFPTYAIGIIVGILVIVLVLIILIVILQKHRMHQNHEEDSHIDDDDKDCEVSMSRVSLESNLDPNEQDVDNISDVE